MRVALVHSFYSSRQPSGENVVVEAQAAVLAAAGHDVTVVARHTDQAERRRGHELRAAWTVTTGHGADPTAELQAFQPDVVHVHNLFPNFGSRWLSRWGGPLVATLHNFRPMCAAGTLQRDGAMCTKCPDGRSLSALAHACYRGSRAATLPLAVSTRSGAAGHPVVSRADALITLSSTWAATYVERGVDAARMHVIPNFVADPGTEPDQTRAQSTRAWLFVGRMTAEKGLVELLEQWPVEEPLDVVGDGPLADRAKAAAGPSVRFRGVLSSAQLRSTLATYQGMVVPSRWFEGALPLVYLESLAAGLPVIAVDGSSTATDVSRTGTGCTVPRGASVDRWRGALGQVRRGRAEFGYRARAAYEARYSPSAWLTATSAVYQSVTSTAGEHVPV